MTDESPIFIVGMPRSGTTLMSNALTAHPRIAIAPETHFLNYWMDRLGPADLGDEHAFEAFWREFCQGPKFEAIGVSDAQMRERLSAAGEISYRTVFESLLRGHAAKQGKARWGEKTPLHHRYVATLLDWFPRARIIYMLRDPRAVVASLLEAPWAPASVEFHACRWRNSVRLLGDWEGDPRVSVVFYESLVTEPGKVLRKVADFVDEPFAEEMLTDRPKGSQAELSQHGEWSRKHWEAASGPIQTTSISRWHERLSLHQVSIVEYLTQAEMRRTGYQPVTSGPGIEAWLALNARRGLAHVRRWVERAHHRLPKMPAADRSL